MTKPSRDVFAFVAVSLIVCVSDLVWAETPPEKMAPAERKAEIERLTTEIKRLQTSPDAPVEWKESLEIKTKLADATWKRWREEEPLRIRSSKLSQSNAAVEWTRTIDKLEDRLKQLDDLDRRFHRNAGLRLFQTRHAELAKEAAMATPRLNELGLNVLSYPHIDGSTSTQPLAMLITCRCFGVPYEWIGKGQRRQTPRGDPYDPPGRDLDFFFSYGRPEPEADLLEFSLQAQVTRPDMERLTIIINRLLATNASTHQAYLNLVSRRSDLGLLARPPSSDELAQAKKQGIDFDVTPCAFDAFVFIVNSSNPVNNLSSAQIREIYSGKQTKWPEGGKVTAYQRDESSGSQQLMRELVMKQTPLAKPDARSAPQLVGFLMSSHFLELTSDKSGIGYSLYYYEHFMSGSPSTKTIAVDGIEPNADTIRRGKYPFVSDVFVVTLKDLDRDAPARKLREWLLSPEGQGVVRESGYVPSLRN